MGVRLKRRSGGNQTFFILSKAYEPAFWRGKLTLYGKIIADIALKLFNMATTSSWWEQWKVFILSALAAAVLGGYALVQAGETDLKVVGFAAFLALLGYVSKEWRGKGVTILGIIGTAAAIFIEQWQSGNFTWLEFIAAVLAALAFAIMPQPKVDTYEEATPIVQAKSTKVEDAVMRMLE